MEGTETGWGRPESAPRWRALLDRALLGGRTGEQHEVPARREPAPDPLRDPLPDPLPPRVAAPRLPAPPERRENGNGYHGRASAPVAYPADYVGYAPGPPSLAPPWEPAPPPGPAWEPDRPWEAEPAYDYQAPPIARAGQLTESRPEHLPR